MAVVKSKVLLNIKKSSLETECEDCKKLGCNDLPIDDEEVAPWIILKQASFIIRNPRSARRVIGRAIIAKSAANNCSFPNHSIFCKAKIHSVLISNNRLLKIQLLF